MKITWTPDALEKASEAGYEAHYDSEPRESPYTYGSEADLEWLAGWDRAAQ